MKINLDHVHVVEVGPRDGLQNEKVTIPTEAKIDYITALADAGLRTIEAGALVRPERGPHMAETPQGPRHIPQDPALHYPGRGPHPRGPGAATQPGREFTPHLHP